MDKPYFYVDSLSELVAKRKARILGEVGAEAPKPKAEPKKEKALKPVAVRPNRVKEGDAAGAKLDGILIHQGNMPSPLPVEKAVELKPGGAPSQVPVTVSPAPERQSVTGRPVVNRRTPKNADRGVRDEAVSAHPVAGTAPVYEDAKPMSAGVPEENGWCLIQLVDPICLGKYLAGWVRAFWQGRYFYMPNEGGLQAYPKHVAQYRKGVRHE